MKKGLVVHALAAATLALCAGCSDEVAGTASGTENTVTVALASGVRTTAASRLAEVRFWEAGSLPEEISGAARTPVAAKEEGGRFSAKLAADKRWNAELVGADSSWRLWIPGIAVPEGDLSLAAGPLQKSATLKGKLEGALGDEARVGIAGSGLWARVSSNGSFSLKNVVGAKMPLVAMRRNADSWSATKIEDWTSASGEAELPASIALPAPLPETSVSAWDCADGDAAFSSSAEALPAPEGDLYRALVPGNGSTALVLLDLCHRTATELARVASSEDLLLFADGGSDWIYAPETDTLWEVAREDGQVVPHPGSYADQVGIRSASSDGGLFASYLYRPEANVLSLYSSAEDFVRDSPTRSIELGTEENAFVQLSGERVVAVGASGAVSAYALEDGSLLDSWTLSGAGEVRGAALMPNGRVATVSGEERAPELRVWEETTGEPVAAIPGLPAGAYGLTH